jgi:hypothetical protein
VNEIDFAKISTRFNSKGILEIFPSFKLGKASDLMVRGKSFYAIYNEDTKLWSRDEFDVAYLIDVEIQKLADEIQARTPGQPIVCKYMNDYSTGSWREYKRWLKDHPDNYHALDQRIIFSNVDTKKSDYASFKLAYPLSDGPIDAYDKLVSRLYSPEERLKFEWAIGSIIAGDSKKIQKFFVFYGEPASGKSTILGIIRDLFSGYSCVFDARTLASMNDFALDFFEKDPLIAIQEDGDLSRIEDNTKLNSIVSHEMMRVNVKFKAPYESRASAMLFMGTNSPIQITDIKSGMIRRLVLITPTNNPHPIEVYEKLMDQIPFEMGAIAKHCLDVYLSLGRSYYQSYRATEMIERTNPFYNFMIDKYYEFTEGITLTEAYNIYTAYCESSNFKTIYAKYKFRDEFRNYFDSYESSVRIDGDVKRNWFSGLRYSKLGITDIKDLETKVESSNAEHGKFIFIKQASRFDTVAREFPAQLARSDGYPRRKWINVDTTLKDIDTSKLHYVKVPENHIVIDFDIRGDDGGKSLEKNLEAASKWPMTYAELSKSGSGIHLHYIYDGDPSKLSRVYDNNVEIKVYTGDASLRRQLTLCNDAEIAHISSGLPLKEELKKVVNKTTFKNEERLRAFIKRNLLKEYWDSTAQSINLIAKGLEDAYSSGMKYDVSDMYQAILTFGLKSTNQKDNCLKVIGNMKFTSAEVPDDEDDVPFSDDSNDLVFFDVEVFPNLLIVCWKIQGQDYVHKMINPTPAELEPLLHLKLVGFNNRKYDNHIIWHRMMGADNKRLYILSSMLVSNDSALEQQARALEAYNLSYTDVYDFASAANKKGLKKWEIELGIMHVENQYPWDKDLPEEHWEEVAEYCANDVRATERVFEELHSDYMARVILSQIAGMTPNSTTNSLTTRIIFEGNKHPQDQFNYPDLSVEFPGYEFKGFKNLYRGEDVGFGGYVYAEPGMYGPSWTFDVESQHPNSIIAMNLFGDYYTKRFKAILDARLAVKHMMKGLKEGMKKLYSESLDVLKSTFDGVFMKFIDPNDIKSLKALSDALKTAINSVYGLTSAKFENAFKDPRNVNNVVALRGALFMITLRDEVIKRGYKVIHIKTDSIKIENPDEEITKFIFEFGKKYGYNFEIEDKFEKLCLVNNAVIIEKLESGKWQAVGKEFMEPYIFKTLFSHELIEFKDLIQVKNVQKSAMYLQYSEGDIEHTKFVGRVSSFVPIKPGCGGGALVSSKDGQKFASVQGCKDWLWEEAETIATTKRFDDINMEYYRKLVDDALDHISEFGDCEQFIA